MPYISISTSKSLSGQEKDALKRAAGSLIPTIPGKTEGGLMVGIIDGQTMYFRGKADPCAYVNVKLFGDAPFEAKKAFTEQFCAAIEEAAGIPAGDIYLTYEEYGNWGINGSLK